MDPDEALARCLAALAEYRKAGGSISMADAAMELADAFEDLDTWLAGGGFRPKRWAVA